MVDIKTWAYTHLSTDATLAGLCGNIVQGYPNAPISPLDLPMVSFYEIDQRSGFYAEDIPFDQESQLAIDVWTGENMDNTAICTAVEAVLVAMLYNIDNSADLFETDTKIRHRAIRASRELTAEVLFS